MVKIQDLTKIILMIKNLLLLTGAETFLLHDKIRFFKKGFGQKYPNGCLETYDAKDEFSILENSILTPSLFGEKRLVFLEDYWTPDNFTKAIDKKFFEKLTLFADTVTVISIESSLDKRTKSAKFLLKEAQVTDFKPLESPQLEHYLIDFATKKGGTLKLKSAQILVRQLGHNLWNLTSEIKKLVLLAEGAEISESMILENTMPHAEVILWDFLADVSQKRTHSALVKLRHLLDRGESIYQLLSMLNREIRIHTIIKSGLDQKLTEKEIATVAGLHPFVVKKTIGISRNFEMKQLKFMYENLVKIDLGIKTGQFQMTTDDQGELILAIEKFIISMKA